VVTGGVGGVTTTTGGGDDAGAGAAGVGEADRSRIFESFFQGQPPVDARSRGSGLGLAIAREYAVAHSR
jgi:K+-sensing histidine kinase KdpD